MKVSLKIRIDLVRQKHLAATVSSFGIIRSRSNVNPAETICRKCDDHNDKENKVRGIVT